MSDDPWEPTLANYSIFTDPVQYRQPVRWNPRYQARLITGDKPTPEPVKEKPLENEQMAPIKDERRPLEDW